MTTYKTSLTDTTPFADYHFTVSATNQMGTGPVSVQSTAAQFNWNEMEGGTESTFFTTADDMLDSGGVIEAEGEEWKVHLFTYSSSAQLLKVNVSIHPCRVLVVAGGQGGGNDMSGHGGRGGGTAIDQAKTIPVNPNGHFVTPGRGGSVSLQNGTNSTFLDMTGVINQGAGGSGSSGNPGSDSVAGPGGTGFKSRIRGFDDWFGSGGTGGGGQNARPPTVTPGTYGRGGRGSNWSGLGFGGEAGQSGCVIVSYRIG